MTPAERLNAALAGRYRIERELGQGGMATVYLAERFVIEIKTTASLQHPHILPLFDSGTVDGFLFYVMPYIQGETIRDKLNGETLFGVRADRRSMRTEVTRRVVLLDYEVVRQP